MYERTIFDVTIIYQVGLGYDAEPLQQLNFQLADYDRASAEAQAKRILELNPAITRYVINMTTSS